MCNFVCGTMSHAELPLHWLVIPRFIQASLCKIQGLFKYF